MVVPGNCGESESDKTIEYSEELNYFYFSPSPPFFPPSPTTFPPSPSYIPPSPYNYNAIYLTMGPAQLFAELALYAEYTIQDRSGVLDVIPGGKLMQINGLQQQHEDINRSIASKELALLLNRRDNGTGGTRHILSDLEFNDSVEVVGVRQFRIGYTGGKVHLILSYAALTYEGLEASDNGDLSTTPEPPLIFQTTSSIRLWHGNHGDWGADFRFGWNWLNIGTFKIEGSALTNEWVFRRRGGKDYIDFPFPELSPNRNREEPTTARITEIPTLALPSTTQQENPYEDFGLGCSEVTGNDGVEAVGIGSWNWCDSTTIQVIQSTLLVDQEEFPLSNSDTLPSDQALAITIDTNSVLVKEIPPLLVLPTAQQEKLDEDLGNDEVDDTGIGGEGTKEGEIVEAQFNFGAFGKRKRKEKTPRGERGNKKTTPVGNYISLEKILQVKKMHLTEAAQHLKVSPFARKRACRENGIKRWPPCDILETPAVFDEDESAPLTSDTLCSDCVPSNQPLVATDDANTVVKEIPPPWISPTPRQENRDENFANDEIDVIGMGAVGTGEGEMEDGQLNYGCSGKWKTIEKKMRGNCGESESDKTIEYPEELNYFYFPPSPPTFPPLPTTFPPLPSYFPPYSPASSNSSKRYWIRAEETTPQQLSPTVRQEKPDEDSDNNEVKEVGMGGVGIGEGGMPTNGKARGGERGGVRIKIPLEEILKYSHMHIEAAARELKVSKSTLKRICRDYNISRWPPRDEHKSIGQSHPDESPTIGDQEQILPLKSNMPLPSNQVSATIDNTHSVTVRANYQDLRIKFRLSLPWRMVELEQEVKKRLQLETGTYYIKYKDEDDGLTLITCDEDLKDCISSSSPLGTHSIEVFLSQKIAHEVRVDQL